jgi:membrane dipeptidase
MKTEPTLTVSDKARELLNNTLVWDMTLPWEPNAMDRTTLPRFKAAGFDVVSLTMDMETLGATVRHIAMVLADIRVHSDTMTLVGNHDEVLEARKAGKLALVLHLQETNPLDGEIDMIEVFYELGVRHMLLAYNQKNRVGDGCAERTDGGLSRFGVRVVQEMNRVGMLVDGSHSGYQTTMEAMEISSAPFIFSHCNAWHVFPHYRNIKDDQIKACAATGGVIGVNGLGEFLDDPHAKSETIFRHIEHMVNLVGPRHVGVGLDYVKDTDGFWDWVRSRPDQWPLVDGKTHENTGFGQPEQIVELCELMLSHQYAEEDVCGILGGNFARVAREVWK